MKIKNIYIQLKNNKKLNRDNLGILNLQSKLWNWDNL